MDGAASGVTHRAGCAWQVLPKWAAPRASLGGCILPKYSWAWAPGQTRSHQGACGKFCPHNSGKGKGTTASTPSVRSIWGRYRPAGSLLRSLHGHGLCLSESSLPGVWPCLQLWGWREDPKLSLTGPFIRFLPTFSWVDAAGIFHE